MSLGILALTRCPTCCWTTRNKWSSFGRSLETYLVPGLTTTRRSASVSNDITDPGPLPSRSNRAPDIDTGMTRSTCCRRTSSTRLSEPCGVHLCPSTIGLALACTALPWRRTRNACGVSGRLRTKVSRPPLRRLAGHVRETGPQTCRPRRSNEFFGCFSSGDAPRAKCCGSRRWLVPLWGACACSGVGFPAAIRRTTVGRTLCFS